MRSLKWSTSHAVFVTEIDDEHKEIFQTVGELQRALSGENPLAGTRELTAQLVARIQDHFAHEERLMRAARYGSLRWHKQKHDGALKQVGQYVGRIETGDTSAALALVEYLTAWLHEHTRLADLMLGSFLRNHNRGLYKMSFQAGTKPLNACAWVDASGTKFNPAVRHSGY